MITKDLIKREEFIMYTLVKEILDTSREKKVDVLVARDMVVASGKEHEEVNAAYAIIHKYYEVIAFFRRSDDEANIEKICTLYAEGKEDELKAFVEEVKVANKL